ncbi:MAG: ABC transporter permease [Deltaproteobacteria bacterium]|nr:ABC transporter permease [Deltaproteobacteria bacterium]
MSSLRQVRFLLGKDLRIELRKKESLVSMAFFGTLILVMLNIANGIGRQVDAETGAGILWVAIIFSSVLGLGRVFAREKENGCVAALLLSPVTAGEIYLAKTLVNFTLMLLAELVLVPVFYVLFGAQLNAAPLTLLPILLLVNLGFSTTGTLVSAISAGTRRNEVLLPILLFPLILPLTALAVKATSGALAAKPLTALLDQLEPMAAFCVVFTAAGYLLFPFAIRED